MNRFETLKRAGEIHLQVQEYTKTILKPNIDLYELAENIERKIKELTNFDKSAPKKGGIAFPTGLSINECAAHWSPGAIPVKRTGEKTGGNTVENTQKNTHKNNTLNINDLIKVDFGVHLNGHIIDGAFSVSFSEKYSDTHQKLIGISQEATECGIHNAGPDAILGEIGSSIQEVIEGYEINEKQVKSTIDLCGHNIGKYQIHNGKAVPNIKIPYNMRMEVGEEYAIETFPTTGTAKVKTPDQMSKNELEYYKTTNNPPDCSHYMIPSYDKNKGKKKLSKGIFEEYRTIYSQFNTLAFCTRWIAKDIPNPPSSILIQKDFIQSYPPLYDVKGSFVAQTEKSIYITENGKVILN
jgi:methionyl aminopeptidase